MQGEEKKRYLRFKSLQQKKVNLVKNKHLDVREINVCSFEKESRTDK